MGWLSCYLLSKAHRTYLRTGGSFKREVESIPPLILPLASFIHSQTQLPVPVKLINEQRRHRKSRNKCPRNIRNHYQGDLREKELPLICKIRKNFIRRDGDWEGLEECVALTQAERAGITQQRKHQTPRLVKWSGEKNALSEQGYVRGTPEGVGGGSSLCWEAALTSSVRKILAAAGPEAGQDCFVSGEGKGLLVALEMERGGCEKWNKHQKTRCIFN